MIYVAVYFILFYNIEATYCPLEHYPILFMEGIKTELNICCN